MKKKETSSRVDTVTVPISLVVRCVSSDSVVGAPLQHFGKIVYHTLPVSFGLDAEGLESGKQILSKVPREILVTAAVKFLQNAKVKESSVSQRKLFLDKKGLSKEEISLAMARSEQETVQRPQHLVEHPEMTHQCCGSVPVSTVSRLRDGIGFTILIGGVGYGVYYLVMKYLGKAVFGRSEERDQMVALRKSIAEMESNLTEMMRGMHEMQQQLQQQQLNLTQIITNIGSLDTARLQETRDMSDVTESINSLKGLLLNRRQFPPTPVTTPVLPAWQLAKEDTASDVTTSSAVTVKTNISTSDCTTLDTDSMEDASCCETVKHNVRNGLPNENSNDENISST